MKNASIFAGLLLLSACGEAPTTQSNGGEASAQAEAKPIAVGEVGKAKGVDITIDSVKVTSEISSIAKAEAGETFVLVGYTIKNTSAETLGMLERPAFTLIDDKGHSYTADEMMGALAVALTPEGSSVSVDLNPGTSTKAGTVWKISKDGFDKATWRIVVETDPALTFALNAGDGNGKAK